MKPKAKKKRMATGMDRVNGLHGLKSLGDFNDLQEARKGKSSLVKVLILNSHHQKVGQRRTSLFSMNPFGDDFGSSPFERRSQSAQIAAARSTLLLRPITSSSALNPVRLTKVRQARFRQQENDLRAKAAAMTPAEIARAVVADKAAKSADAAKKASGPGVNRNLPASSTVGSQPRGYYGSFGSTKTAKSGSAASSMQPGPAGKSAGAGKIGFGQGPGGRG